MFRIPLNIRTVQYNLGNVGWIYHGSNERNQEDSYDVVPYHVQYIAHVTHKVPFTRSV